MPSITLRKDDMSMHGKPPKQYQIDRDLAKVLADLGEESPESASVRRAVLISTDLPEADYDADQTFSFLDLGEEDLEAIIEALSNNVGADIDRDSLPSDLDDLTLQDIIDAVEADLDI